MADQRPFAPGVRGPSDSCAGPGWWQASDGKWYPPEARPGGGWWQASDGKWYPPEARPGGGWPASPPGLDQWGASRSAGVLPRTPREATLQLTGWILFGVSAFIGFVGLFSGQNSRNAREVQEAEVFAAQMLAVAATIAVSGLFLIWRSQRSYERRVPPPFSTTAADAPEGTAAGRHSSDALASRWQRLGARLIDLVVIVGPAVLVTTAFRIPWTRNGELALDVWWGTVGAAVAYESLALAVWGGTVGKHVLGLRVVPLGTSTELSVGRAVLRTAALMLMAALIVPVCVDVAWMLFNSKRQCLHDKVARTVVFKRDATQEHFAVAARLAS